jgi:hypothetical protein
MATSPPGADRVGNGRPSAAKHLPTYPGSRSRAATPAGVRSRAAGVRSRAAGVRSRARRTVPAAGTGVCSAGRHSRALLRPHGPGTCAALRSRVGPSSDGRNAGGEVKGRQLGRRHRARQATGTQARCNVDSDEGPVQRGLGRRPGATSGLGRRAIRVRAGAEPARAAQHDPGPRPKGAQNLSRKYAT